MPPKLTKTVKHVKKIWGEELWIVNGRKYCGKLLMLYKGHQCSLHYHRNKDETFYVLDGKIHMEYEYKPAKDVILYAGDVFHIPPKLVHRFTGLEDSRIIEFSTHHEEADSYRIEKSKKVDQTTWDEKYMSGKHDLI